MKIALSQLNYHIGNFEKNNQKIIDSIQKAKDEGAELIVFAELAIGGYPAKDLLRNSAFLQHCYQSIERIAEHCQDIACIIGAPVPNQDGEGKSLYNAAVLIEQGQVKQITKKSLLPDYDVFDEYRYFEPNAQVSCINFNGKTIALTICEDLWDDDGPNSYVGDIMLELAKENPDLIINIAASPFSYTHFESRKNVLQRNVIKASAPLIYVNQIGAQTDIIFDGRSLALNKKAEVILELKAFEEDLQFVELINNDLKSSVEHSPLKTTEISLIHDALILGLRDYFQKSGFKSAVLGLSGGLDSALVAALACEALGPENVLSILMPSVYSTDHSLKDALDLVENTGCQHQIIPIKDIASAFESTLEETFAGRDKDTTEENIQARTRGTLLMAISNKFGNILLNTSNKSEAAVGYGTLYGDMAGSISVIGDVYKTQAYGLAKYINRDREIIPINTIVKPPSAELRPDQKDSDSLPDYDLLDAVLFQLIEMEKSKEDVINLGFDETLVNRIYKLLGNAEFKRFQAPPILRVSPKSFGPGRSMPLVAKYSFGG
ncbi:NAD+ synthase [Sphingobacterium mizutaii NBRC 14946 = DSM 11724]|uniref:Glutamine-dependent NAD(+) synthetase n=2 Tax=Sphingobacterium mizutaii TaxID=1010 RepID=A0AAJ5BZ71_9SPHI|nr:NAD+ synthase [Sphingobacterium mizutaii]GEM70153.1 NAD+ synthase [Sphingobacterium mizutaii NBRC 14946 = DSM 11724]SDL37202.1 NH(3)-dependent NAD(+) synthetase [Sphingobacterium mizutaii]SNV43249.1 Glutamine-dependent NAD(+) synthetase [Sphingobacterium mizutaii]